jgi:DNA polymerase III alpha subunit (gram-positive type)
MDWWAGNPDAWSATQVDQQDPEVVMRAFTAWVDGQSGIPVFVAYPAGFDFTFVHWYLHRFTGASPFSHSALDMKTLAMVLIGTGYRHATKNHWPRTWFPAGTRHTHRALDDAIEQGREFCAMLAEMRRIPPRYQREPGAKWEAKLRPRRR